MSSGSPNSSTLAAEPPSGSTSAGRARFPTMTGCTNSTTTCAASAAATAGAHRDQPPTSVEPLRHRLARRGQYLGVGAQGCHRLRAPSDGGCDVLKTEIESSSAAHRSLLRVRTAARPTASSAVTTMLRRRAWGLPWAPAGDVLPATPPWDAMPDDLEPREDRAAQVAIVDNATSHQPRRASRGPRNTS